MSAPQRQLDLTSRREGDDVHVRVAGEVDLHTSPVLRERLLALLDHGPQRVIVDLSEVAYVDSSGVGTLVELKRRLDRSGGRVVLVGMQPRVRSVFEITRLDRFFTVVATLDEARGA